MSDTHSPSESSPTTAPVRRPVPPADAPVAPTKDERPAPDPTRYGDWEKNGRCIDF
ncbi:DUF1674 domain-containing protein [Dyella sp.]|jgi:hypothetical protein|uniref:DUF1674 domain-containing protein n=1 Tax=Dyella sp. TaxID=1869338 RepID=UPI002D767CA1|nr:DUF1674 domain-containing protein [Dyella sp.]HET6432449.1 DUF1674 domain-containing protein [Dyella sp.]